MPLKIRLARAGAKKRPYYQIVIADARSPRDGRFLERVGSYNPMLPRESGDRIKLDTDRIEHWLSVGARPTDRVHRFLDAAGLLKREPKNNPHKGRLRTKALERIEAKKEAEEAKTKAAEEAAAAPAEAPAAEEAPAEAPAEEAAAEEAPVEEAAAEEATVEAAAEEAPAEETPAEEAPADDAEDKDKAAE